MRWLVLLGGFVTACAEAPGTVESALGGPGAGLLAIDPIAIEIVGPAGQLATAPFNVSGSSLQLANLTWIGDIGNVFDSEVPPCKQTSCDYSTILLPVNGIVSCTPSAAITPSATMRITDSGGATAAAMVICRATTASASFSTPDSTNRISAPVGGMATTTVTVTNTGSSELTVTAALDGSASSAAWTVLDCSTTPCLLGVGDVLTIPVRLSPTAHGDLDTTLEVSAPPAVGTQTVNLLGTGLGGKLRVDQPSSPTFTLDFGTIAKNQSVTLPIQMTNVGNVALAVTPSIPGAPFALTSVPVTIDPSQQGMIPVSCSAPSALPLQTKTISLTTDAYAQNTPSVEVRCTVANTNVQVTNPLDFGELRVGDTRGLIEVVIANPPGNGSVTLQRLELVDAPLPLTLMLDQTLPATIAAGGQLIAKLNLDTAEDVVLEGVTLEAEVTEVDTVVLAQPVTGKVGTPAAVMLPAELQLGTVCVGTPVDGEITLSNIGTATLTLQRPAMSSQSFVPVFQSPTDFPAPLAPGDKATVGVMLASATAGLQEGTLAWDVDVPDMQFQTKVAVELVEEGTAVSPASLTFGGIDITAPPTAMQVITLENCGPDTAIVAYDRVIAIEGTSGAWQLDPPAQSRELLPDETMRVRVAFDPEQPGPHLGELHLGVGAEDRVVRLVGEATGALPEETSFYACGCSGSSDPTRGWPIFLAVPFVLRRRRC